MNDYKADLDKAHRSLEKAKSAYSQLSSGIISYLATGLLIGASVFGGLFCYEKYGNENKVFLTLKSPKVANLKHDKNLVNLLETSPDHMTYSLESAKNALESYSQHLMQKYSPDFITVDLEIHEKEYEVFQKLQKRVKESKQKLENEINNMDFDTKISEYHSAYTRERQNKWPKMVECEIEMEKAKKELDNYVKHLNKEYEVDAKTKKLLVSSEDFKKYEELKENVDKKFRELDGEAIRYHALRAVAFIKKWQSYSLKDEDSPLDTNEDGILSPSESKKIGFSSFNKMRAKYNFHLGEGAKLAAFIDSHKGNNDGILAQDEIPKNLKFHKGLYDLEKFLK